MSCLTLSNAILAPRAGSWDKYCTVTQCETVIVRSRKAQSKSLEAIQKRDIHITHNLTRGMPYFSMLYCAYLNSLASRRDLSRDFAITFWTQHPVSTASSLHLDPRLLPQGLDLLKPFQ